MHARDPDLAVRPRRPETDLDVQFSDVTVGPDGRAYITWAGIVGELPGADGEAGQPQTFVIRERTETAPGSAVFGPVHTVYTETNAIPFGGFLHANDFRIATYPKSDVTTVGGQPRIFVIWDACTHRFLDTVCEEPQIKLSYSLDADGATWSAPVVLSNGGDNYFPTISADRTYTTNNLSAAWFSNYYDIGFHNAQDVQATSINPSRAQSRGLKRLTGPQSNEPESDPLLGGAFIGDYIEGVLIKNRYYVALQRELPADAAARLLRAACFAVPAEPAGQLPGDHRHQLTIALFGRRAVHAGGPSQGPQVARQVRAHRHAARARRPRAASPDAATARYTTVAPSAESVSRGRRADAGRARRARPCGPRRCRGRGRRAPAPRPASAASSTKERTASRASCARVPRTSSSSETSPRALASTFTAGSGASRGRSVCASGCRRASAMRTRWPLPPITSASSPSILAIDAAQAERREPRRDRRPRAAPVSGGGSCSARSASSVRAARVDAALRRRSRSLSARAAAADV